MPFYSLTDFAIQWNGDKGLMLWVWQDLGSGGSPFDVEWMTQANDIGRTPWYGFIAGVQHVPQSVRNRYCDAQRRP